MRRRVMFGLMVGGLLTGCGAREKSPSVVAGSPSISPLPSPSPVAGRPAVAADYAWFRHVSGLRKGFCFVWARVPGPSRVLSRLGGKELERIAWPQMVDAGDGQRGTSDKYYFGVSRLGDDWSLIVEDNGELGEADELLRPLSAGTTVVCLYRAVGGASRFLVLEDESVALEFDPVADGPRSGGRANELAPMIKAAGFGSATGSDDRTAAAFALAERLTGVPLDLDGLQKRTYLFSVVPTGQ